MATKKSDKFEVVRTGRMDTPGVPITSDFRISIERFLSKTNRRLYRQARNYKVKIDLDVDATQVIHLYALTNSWMNERALKMAYSMYLENSKDERSRLKGKNIARWQDFRTTSGTGLQILDPVQYDTTFAPVPLTSPSFGVFEDTIVVDASGVQRSFTWGPSGVSRYSILDEYDKAGNAQDSPNSTTGDMPYDDLMADDDAVMAEALQTRGSDPPYSADTVNQQAQWVRVATLGTGATQKLSSGFFDAPCGFVMVVLAGDGIVQANKLQWTVQAGDYKGVHAPSMLE